MFLKANLKYRSTHTCMFKKEKRRKKNHFIDIIPLAMYAPGKFLAWSAHKTGIVSSSLRFVSKCSFLLAIFFIAEVSFDWTTLLSKKFTQRMTNSTFIWGDWGHFSKRSPVVMSAAPVDAFF